MKSTVQITTENETPTFYYIFFSTPMGNAFACSSDKGIAALLFGEEANLYIEKNKHTNKSVWIQTRNEYLSRLEKQLSEYFRGQRDKFDLTLDIRGTSFQSRIWDMIIQIPFGETRFYSELATETGDVKKTRAIANAIAQNNILLVIPCHRVIGIGNKLTGYRGGTERKRWLLEFERTRSQPNQNLLF